MIVFSSKQLDIKFTFLLGHFQVRDDTGCCDSHSFPTAPHLDHCGCRIERICRKQHQIGARSRFDDPDLAGPAGSGRIGKEGTACRIGIETRRLDEPRAARSPLSNACLMMLLLFK